MAIRDFVMIEEASTPEEVKAKAKANVRYVVEEMDETAFVVKRETTRASSFLVVIPTAEQYYIKKGDNNIALTPAEYSKFMADAPEDIDLDDVVWLDSLKKGKKFGERLLQFLIDAGPVLKYGFMFYDETVRYSYRFSAPSIMSALLDEYEGFVKWMVKYLSEFASKKENAKKNVFERFINNFEEFRFLLQYFGEDNMKKLIMAFNEGGYSLRTNAIATLFDACINNATERVGRYGYRGDPDADAKAYKSALEHRSSASFDFKRWMEYLISFEREGYANTSNFFQEWADDLRMQNAIFGKIKDKYPEYLMTHHAKLSVKVSIIQREIDVKAFAENYERNKDLEWSNNEYIFIVPKTAQDMIDEAEQQNNCLRSYVDRVTNGETKIVFLRKKKSPASSYITIQVNNAGRIVQVRKKMNRRVSSGEALPITAWAKKKDIEFNYNACC